MVKISYIKIPSIRVGSIGPTSNIGTGGATPAPLPPITYLTQWKIVGNSEVHTDPYLTSWKVSGNSVVDNNTILSCGDLGQDGMYHVKISNGAAIFDIALDEPLRKVNSVVDSIEFPSGTEGKALVTRHIGDAVNNIGNTIAAGDMDVATPLTPKGKSSSTNVLSTIANQNGVSGSGSYVYFLIDGQPSALLPTWKVENAGKTILYELATPTTELIDVSQFPVSATDTYTSANVTPYSAFEHTENKEIWSCGEYNATDGKYHILVKPQEGSIADIALDEPLRKINSVADSIEFPSGTEGKALVTRNLKSVDLGTLKYTKRDDVGEALFMSRLLDRKYVPECVGLIANTTQKSVISGGSQSNNLRDKEWCYYYLSNNASFTFYIRLVQYKNYTAEEFASAMIGKEFIYELATPTTELVDAPQIEEAESYTCEISQGGKAVSWSSFSTE